MTASALAQRVRSLDYTAQNEARSQGSAALIELEPLLAEGDEEIRGNVESGQQQTA
ncbi:MAG: hypothetical protein MJE77_11810 [Proteobacteria bacterium]|nr:hypothetical protein [Pseudomonadota bacterium]